MPTRNGVTLLSAVVGWFAAIALAFVAIGLQPTDVGRTDAATVVATVVTSTQRVFVAEDDPAFDCRLDGNRVCAGSLPADWTRYLVSCLRADGTAVDYRVWQYGNQRR